MKGLIRKNDGTSSAVTEVVDKFNIPSGVEFQNDGTDIKALISALAALSAAEIGLLDGLTAGTEELNMAADSSVNTELVTEPKTLTAAESGKTLIFDSTTGVSITLPAKALGLRFNVKVKTPPTSGDHILKTPGGAKIMQGGAIVNSTDVPAVNEEQVNFVANTTLAGDSADVICDNTYWHVNGRSGTASALTFTEPT